MCSYIEVVLDLNMSVLLNTKPFCDRNAHDKCYGLACLQSHCMHGATQIPTLVQNSLRDTN